MNTRASQIEQLKHLLPIEQLSLPVLFALRLLFDKRDDVSDLDRDIAELAHFPERITASYRQEWEFYVRRALIRYLREHSHTRASILIDKILADVQYIQEQDSRYKAMLRVIEETQTVMTTDNTRVFPSPWRQQIMALMLPVTSVLAEPGEDD